MFCASKSPLLPVCETFGFERTKAHPLHYFLKKEKQECYCAAHRSLQSEQMKIFCFRNVLFRGNLLIFDSSNAIMYNVK